MGVPAGVARAQGSPDGARLSRQPGANVVVSLVRGSLHSGGGRSAVVTIPDLGHCVGSGSAPAEGTLEPREDARATGVCPACSGRFPLDHGGMIPLHDAAEVEEREAWGGAGD